MLAFGFGDSQYFQFGLDVPLSLCNTMVSSPFQSSGSNPRASTCDVCLRRNTLRSSHLVPHAKVSLPCLSTSWQQEIAGLTSQEGRQAIRSRSDLVVFSIKQGAWIDQNANTDMAFVNSL